MQFFTLLTLAALLQGTPAPSDLPPQPPTPGANAVPGEEVVDPYMVDNANAGAKPFEGTGMAEAFHGKEGIRRIVTRFVTLDYEDPVIGEIFEGHDRVRLERTLFEQFCYILNAGCAYSGRDMAKTHADMGVQQADMNRLVVVLQKAMREENIAFSAQNRFLAKLAPMRPDVLQK